MASETEAMVCPVCEGAAEREVPPGPSRDAHQINCTECGRYRISDTSQVVIASKLPETRRVYLEDAKRQAGPGEVPYINNIIE